MSSSGPWWASPLIALVGPVVGVVLTLLAIGRRTARSRFGDEKRTIYADFLIACARLQDSTVWTPASEESDDPTPLLRQIRGTAMPGHRGAVDERHRAGYEEASTRLSAALNQFTKAARLDLDVRAPMSEPSPLDGSAT